jgi:hypothetical protein
VRKTERNRPLGRPVRRWEHPVIIIFEEVCWEGVDWIDLTQDRDVWWTVVNTAMNLGAV